jgi:hypothetical protein
MTQGSFNQDKLLTLRPMPWLEAVATTVDSVNECPTR